MYWPHKARKIATLKRKKNNNSVQISGSPCKNAGTHVSCMYVSSHDNKTNEPTVYAHEFAMALDLTPKKRPC